MEIEFHSYITKYLGYVFAVEVDCFCGNPPAEWRASLCFDIATERERTMTIPGRFESRDEAMAAGESYAETLIDRWRDRKRRKGVR